VRVLLDTNIWISYLLTRDETTTIRQVVRHCTGRRVQLLLPEELIEELKASIAKRSDLSRRISNTDVEELVTQLRQIALIPPSLQQELAQYSRDPMDDYLVAYGLIHTCEYLVTGDKDLLALQQVQALRIVEPADFLQIVQRQ
jgi:putative PIN family toxin of toxin-antitoxin system